MGKILKAGLLVGAVSGAVYLARKYFQTDFDKVVDKASTTLKDIGSDLTKKDKAVTQGVQDTMRKVG